MNINLENEKLENAIKTAVAAAVVESIGSWEVKKLIQEKASEVLLNASIEQAVAAAIESADMEKLTRAVVEELEKAVVSLATNTIRETMCKTVFDIRFAGVYMDTNEKKREMAAILAEMK